MCTRKKHLFVCPLEKQKPSFLSPFQSEYPCQQLGTNGNYPALTQTRPRTRQRKKMPELPLCKIEEFPKEVYLDSAFWTTLLIFCDGVIRCINSIKTRSLLWICLVWFSQVEAILVIHPESWHQGVRTGSQSLTPDAFPFRTDLI